MNLQKIKKYDFPGNRILRDYVSKKYSQVLTNTQLHFYFDLAIFEQDQNGLCKPISANYNDLAKITHTAKGSVETSLPKLEQENLIELVIGETGPYSKIATTIRRRDISELKTKQYKKCLKDYKPVIAKEVAEILNQRGFIYQGRMVNPKFVPRSTGRIYSNSPNLQGEKNKNNERIKGLVSGLERDEVLIECDFKHAEPTIVKSLIPEIDLTQYPDLYQQLADEENISRDDAKTKVNSLANNKSAKYFVNHWTIPEDSIFHQYAIAIDNLKVKTWEQGKPIKGQIRRHTKTLLGTVIECPKGEIMHKGQLLNRKIQGTVADIVNNASLEILNKEQEKQWTYLIPVHDSVIVKSKRDCSKQIAEIMERHALKSGVEIKVKISKYKPVPKLGQL